MHETGQVGVRWVCVCVCVCVCVSVLRDLWAFSFFPLAGSESALDFPFLACCHICEGPPSLCSLFALSQCRISRPFLPAPRCCPKQKCSVIPHSCLNPQSQGRMLTQPRTCYSFPTHHCLWGISLQHRETQGRQCPEISPGKVYFTLGSTLERDKGDLEHVPRSPIGRRQDSGHVRR